MKPIDEELPMPLPGEGVHIRAFVAHAADAPDLTLMTFQVWPLPERVLAGLQAAMKKEVVRYLTKKKIVNGQVKDLSTKGPTH